MTRTLSTAEERRAVVISSAVHVFARHGFRATTIAAVAEHAGISPAYASKLFSSKERLFLAALDECHARILAALDGGAARAAHDAPPEGVVSAMGAAYAELIADRDLLMLQVHALATTDHPEIARSMRTGLAQVVELVRRRSGAPDEVVQRFVATGQLCHLLTALDLFETATATDTGQDPTWAVALTTGIRHVPARDTR